MFSETFSLVNGAGDYICYMKSETSVCCVTTSGILKVNCINTLPGQCSAVNMVKSNYCHFVDGKTPNSWQTIYPCLTFQRLVKTSRKICE